ncbi:MAG TPA: hypothetical protein VFX54_03715 [Candidatus Binatia bacterium]|nr:hypothetical protein [Candidatus Binatia bacterium]
MLHVTQFSQHSRSIVLRAAIALLAMLVLQPNFGFSAQTAYEPIPVLSVSKILPPDLLSGPNHRVEERVYNDGYLNTYRVGSKFGTFVAVSTPMLRKRINEINAMVRMEQIQGTKEFIASLKEAGTDTLVGFKNLVTQPVETVKGAASGLGVAFRRAGDAITGAKRSDTEDSRIKDLIGFSKTKREYAYQLGVDAYSDNEKLQDRLNEISWAGYSGGLTWAAAMAAVPGGAGLAITISGTHKLLNEVFRTTPPVDLRRGNGEKLKAMDVHPEVADVFLNNTVYSPRYQTLLVYALDEMKGVGNRATFVRLAAATTDKDLAYFRERQAEMYAGYHKAVAPFETFIALGEFAAARTTKNEVVFNVPLDHLVWTEPMAKLLTAADSRVTQLTRPANKQLWVTGTVSARARKEIESRGWQVQERSEERLLSWSESYPKYEKPEERIPSGLVTLNFKSVGVGIGSSSGEGVLNYQGREYPFTISGLNLGDLGVSSFQGAGKVYDLKNLNDFAGNYAGSEAGFAVRGGQSELSMRNGKGVTVVVLASEGKESGTRIKLGASGVNIKLKN